MRERNGVPVGEIGSFEDGVHLLGGEGALQLLAV
jgi:hypothetical protein